MHADIGGSSVLDYSGRMKSLLDLHMMYTYTVVLSLPMCSLIHARSRKCGSDWIIRVLNSDPATDVHLCIASGWDFHIGLNETD